MNIESLRKLYIQELKDLYSAENQLLEALPKMAAAASDEELKQAFSDHLKETQSHVARLETIFSKLEFAPGGHKCKAMEGLVKEGEELLKSGMEDAVLDAALIAAAQRVEHYEMAGYGVVRAYAEKLGEQEAADMLDATLQEEGEADRHLSRLAERRINFLAMNTN
ncbi:YciE/YciF ferroxidase family protein [Lignipirellula cremea]|uniref:Uncharacterized protein n=1 Tax=Lignipirellula cremea TaxID=2528010 RepID=A0A518DNU9_9BACT|nr:ferritin-like domain-containing protein [Lignipirellula cremea]QDU93483.1 hypothetical protein Pla8534_12630 [Lignipirellula cremea]